MFVTVFFAISGMVLYHNYSNYFLLKAFYFNRWKAIFPAYYLCLLYFFYHTVKFKKVFYIGNKYRLLLALIGKDCYFGIGEWFLGEIIIIYILYPLILIIFKKNIIILPILLISTYIWLINFFEINKKRNITICLLSFYFGIVTKKYCLDKKYYALASSIILHIILIYVKIPSFKYKVFIHLIQGFSLYLILMHLAKYVMETKVNIIFKEISKLSFCIYLFHHKIILEMKGIIDENKWSNSIINIGVIILITLMKAKILYITTNSLFQWYYFKKVEEYFKNIY